MTKREKFCNRAEAFEAHDDTPLSPESGTSIGDVIRNRYSRRDVVRGSLGVAAALSLFGASILRSGSPARAEAGLDFDEVAAGIDDKHHLAEGFEADILLRWGDPLFPD